LAQAPVAASPCLPISSSKKLRHAQLRISAIADGQFNLIADGVSA
jgi:hypothetical protein